MKEAWRIVKTKYARNAFDGEGARVYGGRWNSIGVPMVYTAANTSLAVLEILVHLDASEILLAYSLCKVKIHDDLVKTLDRRRLPADWRTAMAANQLRLIGDRWAAKKESVVLRVPSVIVPNEDCLLINPLHPDARKIVIEKPVPFTFDERLR